MLFEISKNLIKLRYAKINHHKKFAGSQFAKLNPGEILKQNDSGNKSTQTFLFLRYSR